MVLTLGKNKENSEPISLLPPAGQHLPSGDQRLRGGGHHRAGQEEDGAGPPGHPEDGHHGEDGPAHWRRSIQASNVFV